MGRLSHHLDELEPLPYSRGPAGRSVVHRSVPFGSIVKTGSRNRGEDYLLRPKNVGQKRMDFVADFLHMRLQRKMPGVVEKHFC